MGQPVQLNINAKGHRFLELEGVEKAQGVVGEWGGVTLGKVLYLCAKANLMPSIDVGTTIIDTVIEVAVNGTGGNAITLTSAAGSAVDVGELAVAGNDITFTYKTGVTTIANFETLIGAMAPCTFGQVSVKKVSATPASTLTVVTDAFGPTNFLRGSTSGLLYKFDGTEDAAAAITGLADGTYALAATADYFKVTGIITGLSGFTAGDELWAKHDATLANHAGLTAGKYSKRMGVAKSTTEAQLADGEVFLIS